MNIFKNILALLVGFIVGSLVNGALISISSSIIAPPEGVDVNNLEGLKAGIHLFEPKHFLFPFLAHALGTFFGTIIATLIAATHKFKFAMAIGVLFFLAGIVNVIMLPGPMWFNATDIALAYLPMAFLAHKLVTRKNVQ
jgi:hypothetical protein